MKTIIITRKNKPRSYNPNKDISNAINAAKWEAKDLSNLISEIDGKLTLLDTSTTSKFSKIKTELFDTSKLAKANSIYLSKDIINGSPRFRNGTGSVTYKTRIMYKGADITSGAMRAGVKLKWLLSRNGQHDIEWEKKNDPINTGSNTDTMEYTYKELSGGDSGLAGCEIANPEILEEYIKTLN